MENPEDQKLVVLARATRARTGAAQGAALRDLDGRTYAGATVDLPSLQIAALEVCIAMAVASGAQGVEAAVILGDSEPSGEEATALREFAGSDVPVYWGTPAGQITTSQTT